MFSDIVKVIDFHACVPALLRIENDVRSFLASAKAHVGFYFYIREPFRLNSLLEFGHQPLGASIFAVHVLADETKPFHKSLLACWGSTLISLGESLGSANSIESASPILFH
jgi:hypothetical protein